MLLWLQSNSKFVIYTKGKMKIANGQIELDLLFQIQEKSLLKTGQKEKDVSQDSSLKILEAIVSID